MSIIRCTVCEEGVPRNAFKRHRRTRRHIKKLIENDNSGEFNCRTVLAGKTLRHTKNGLLFDVIFPSYKSVVRQWSVKCQQETSCAYAEYKNLFGYESKIKLPSKSVDTTTIRLTENEGVPHQLLSSLSDKLYNNLSTLQQVPLPIRKSSSTTTTSALPIVKPLASMWDVDDAMAVEKSHAVIYKGQLIHPPPAPKWTDCLASTLASTPSTMAASQGITNHIQAIVEYFNIFYESVKNKLEEFVHKLNSFKLNAILHLKLIKLDETQLVKLHLDDPLIIDHMSDLDAVLYEMCEELTTKFDNLEHIRNSGWTLKSVNGLELQVSVYNNLTGTSSIKGAHHNFPIPKILADKKALINVQGGEEGECFREAIGVKLMCMRGASVQLGRSSLYKATSSSKTGKKSKTSSHGLYKNLNFSMISFPTELEDIRSFEEGNSVCVNVFAYDNESNLIYPLHVGKYSNLSDISKQKLEENNGDALLVEGIWDLLYLDPTQRARQTVTCEKKKRKTAVVTTSSPSMFLDCEAIDDDDDKGGDDDNNDVEGVKEDEFGHFLFIKNLPKLLGSQLSKNRHRKIICRCCLRYYSKKGYLSHFEKCGATVGKKGDKGVQPIMPGEQDIDNSKLVFNNRYKKYEVEVPYVIYADFESALVEKITKRSTQHQLNEEGESVSSGSDSDDAQVLNTSTSSTSVVHIHEPTSFCFLTVSRNPTDKQTNKYQPKIYRGPNAVSIFWKAIEQEVARIGTICSKTNVPMKLSVDEVNALRESATKCFLCEKTFTATNYKVVDHDHLTGDVRGVAHSECNLLYRRAHFVPVVFHNGSAYDFKLIIKEIVTNDDAATKSHGEGRKRLDNISVIASSTETLISFEKRYHSDFVQKSGPRPGMHGGGKMTIRFIDSMRFMNSSLSTLANNLSNDLKNQTRNAFPKDKKFEMACRKGVFPYEYIKSLETYHEKELPPIEAFTSSLNCGQTIDEGEYEFACNFFKEFECKDLGEYSDTYLKIDTTLLADVFENFRNLCLTIYKLDPLWHYSAPGLSWNAMLKMNISNDVELIREYDQYLFAESAVRGGLCTVSKRLVEANNPRMGELYDDNKPTNYLMYFDANNLYGYSMSMPLPTGQYRWLDEGDSDDLGRLRKISNMVSEWSEESDTGYLLEVDIDYPQNLHSSHNDFPLCPERVCTPQTGNNSKLINTLFNKKKYVTHVAYLKRVLTQGLILKRVHRVLCFAQRAWLAEYININTEYRKKATSKFDVEFFKLMNNVIFGKCLENVRARRNIQLVYSDITIKNLVADPRFKRRLILNEETNLCLVEMGRKVVLFDKPVCIGATILDLSKCVMMDFHYDVMKQLLPKAQLCYHDTDSLIYDIPCENSLEDIYTGVFLENREKYFDFSSLPTAHTLYSNVNHKVPGMFSDELAGSIGLGFVGLRPKVYSLKILEEDNVEKVIKKAKGTKKNVVQMRLNYDLYKRVLSHGATICTNDDDNGEPLPMSSSSSNLDQLEQRGLYITQYNIQSKHMTVRTLKMRKLALSWNDDKRYVCPDGVHTFAWGYSGTNTTTTSTQPYNCIPETHRAELVYREGQAPLLVFPSSPDNDRECARSTSRKGGKRENEDECGGPVACCSKKMRAS